MSSYDSSLFYKKKEELSNNSYTDIINQPNSEDLESIPYHARENARPFTYGNLPKDFKPSDLNHVSSSPTTARKIIRPSITHSPPVLRKMPSREEFEEMLLERREKALLSQNNRLKQLEQNAAIQKDLDELQERLNKTLNSQEVSLCDEPTALVKYHFKQMELDSPANLEGSRKLKLKIDNFIFDDSSFERKRSETPSFPLQNHSGDRCISPYPFNSTEHLEQTTDKNIIMKGIYKNDMHVVEPHLVKFAKDTSEYWYKPHVSREDAVVLLRDAPSGAFLIRNSTTYKNAYGLVLKVTKPPGSGNSLNYNQSDLVRHFLLEPTNRGIHLKGCTNEPVFASLSAFVYQHSITPLALPCKLIIPEHDILSLNNSELDEAQMQVLKQGAACNVLYLYSLNMESLTGDEAVRKAVTELYSQNPLPEPVEIHLKVSLDGVTITDNTRRMFFRKHYIAKNISHFDLDPDNRVWSSPTATGSDCSLMKTIFAFVAKPLIENRDNECHVLCDLAPKQPASAIVSFAKKVLPLNKGSHNLL